MVIAKTRFGISAVVALLVFVSGCARMPSENSRSAWEALKEARQEGAERLAPELWIRASECYDAAVASIARENEHWYPAFSYAAAESLLACAYAEARDAKAAAVAERQRREELLSREIDGLRRDLELFQDGHKRHLARIPARRALTEAGLLVAAAGEIRERATIWEAELAVARAARAVAQLAGTSAGEPTDSHALANGKRMVAETVEWTDTTDSVALVVIKTERRAYLFRDGRVAGEYPVDLGFASWRQKTRAGDGATPEGIYRVTRSRERGSRYYKALALDYPNAHDRTRFEHNQRSGLVSSGAAIGGNIEIHGEGGRGEDWTDGCVALSNQDMDCLMAAMRVGDRVTIVRHLGDRLPWTSGFDSRSR